MKYIKEIIPYVIIIIVVVLIRTFLVTPAVVNGDSMEDTLFDGELVLVNKIGKDNLKRFDIIVIRYDNERIIKRIIGLPNEKIVYSNNILYIDDKVVETPFEFEYTNDFENQTKDNEYFVLGDNRNVSKDSRIIGPVNIKSIDGKVNFLFFPFKKFGEIE